MQKYLIVTLSVMALILVCCTEKSDLLESNKALVVKANDEILNNGNLLFADEVFSKDYGTNGPDWIKDYIGNLRTAFPDLQVTIEPIIAEGDQVAWLRTHTGMHKGDYMGFSATNKKITWRTMVFSTIVDGKIVEESVVSDFQQVMQREKLMPITANSDRARTLYIEAFAAIENFENSQARKLLHETLQEDPDFFLANYFSALFNFGDSNKFKEYGKKSINCKANLSVGELLLKEALSKLLDDPKADVTYIGMDLTNMYPKDVNTYYQLSFYQGIIEDIEGRITTLESAINNLDKPAPRLYNALGYGYMRLEKYKEAAIAFDKYIEVAPNHPNPYDSKGEFFMNIKEYRKAYDSYMKAYKIDSLAEWRLKRAMKAKIKADSVDNKL